MNVRSMTLLGMLAAVLALAAGVAHGAPQPTRGQYWLVSGPSREYCGPVPQVSTMEMISPSSFSPSCNPAKYHGALARVWIGPLIMATVVVIAFVLVCLSFCRRSSSSTFTSAGVYISVNSSFLEKSKEGPMACVASVGVVALIGMTVALVGSDQVHGLIFDVNEVFRANYQYVETTLGDATQAIISMSNASAASTALEEAGWAGATYRENSNEIMNDLLALDRLRTAFMILTTLFVAAATIGGAVAIALKRSALVGLLLVVGMVALLLVWGNFAVYALAANVIRDMCTTINGCHFCYADGGSICPMCDAPWFQSMSACPEAAQDRFLPVTTFADVAMDGAAADVCSDLDKLCSNAGLACYNSLPCSAHNLRASGITTVVCIPAVAPQNCSTVSAVATDGPAPFMADAAAVETSMATFSAWAKVYVSLKSLNCATNEAFVESVPLGTFNLLQQTLCPKIENPANPPMTAFSTICIGLLIAAFSLPLALCVLFSARRRARFSGKDAERSPLLR